MDSAKLNDWMQIVGIFAVVASLIFVGLQMQQDRRIAEMSTYQDRAIASSNLTLGLLNSRSYGTAARKTQIGDSQRTVDVEGWASPLEFDEAMRGIQATRAMMFMFDNSFYQYENGFLPEEHWLRTRNALKATMRVPFARWAVSQILDEQRPSFRGELIAIDEELTAEN